MKTPSRLWDEVGRAGRAVKQVFRLRHKPIFDGRLGSRPPEPLAKRDTAGDGPDQPTEHPPLDGPQTESGLADSRDRRAPSMRACQASCTPRRQRSGTGSLRVASTMWMMWGAAPGQRRALLARRGHLHPCRPRTDFARAQACGRLKGHRLPLRSGARPRASAHSSILSI